MDIWNLKAKEQHNLKPCPFCGGEATKCPCSEPDCNRIKCKKCGVEIVVDLDDYQHNVNLWNTRPSIPDKDMKLKLYEIESAIRDHKEKRGLELCAELRGLLDGG